MKVDLSRYGRAERGGVMRRRCFNDESAVSNKLQTKQHIEGQVKLYGYGSANDKTPVTPFMPK
ncbi:hypothetical protein F2Q69_00060232 [Brassica cretica]|uniref:Uncharacterized protein n=1 Tax=Brassica cretica TaxID=69181 RepID=A0A8S9RQN5_BRACR|nr:hypothetical protein F2Q69_00060232 [Brassica cretica]